MSAKRFIEPVAPAAPPAQGAPAPATSEAGPRLHRTAPSDHPARNPGIPLDLDVVRAIRVNRSAVERRAVTIPTRRTVKKQWQAAWLLRAVTLMDLTTLSGDDTPGTVRRLCAKARRPLRDDLAQALGVDDLGITVAAVCVYHAMVPTAVEALAGTRIPVAAVSTGFPAGLRSERQSPRERARSTWSSLAPTCSPETTRRCTTKCTSSAKRAGTRT
jgi:hypothetical protein